MSAEGITRVRRGALAIPNATVYDDSLSYSALGILAVLLARPDDAPKGYRTLMRPGARVGQAAILSAFRELRAAGYRYQFLRTGKSSDGRPKVYTDTYIYDAPVSLEQAKREHFEVTGQVAIEQPDRRKQAKLPEPEQAAQDTEPEAQPEREGARLCDAHKRDAHGSAAHKPDAQTPGGLSGVVPSSLPHTQINQAIEEIQDQELPAQPTQQPGDDATPKNPFALTPEQMETNRRGAALAKAQLRARGPFAERGPSGCIDEEQGA